MTTKDLPMDQEMIFFESSPSASYSGAGLEMKGFVWIWNTLVPNKPYNHIAEMLAQSKNTECLSIVHLLLIWIKRLAQRDFYQKYAFIEVVILFWGRSIERIPPRDQINWLAVSFAHSKSRPNRKAIKTWSRSLKPVTMTKEVLNYHKKMCQSDMRNARSVSRDA